VAAPDSVKAVRDGWVLWRPLPQADLALRLREELFVYLIPHGSAAAVSGK